MMLHFMYVKRLEKSIFLTVTTHTIIFQEMIYIIIVDFCIVVENIFTLINDVHYFSDF